MSSIPLENKPKSKRYFTQETEKAIIKYNNSLDPVEKSKIYENEIHYAFFKLTENIIHTFKFYHTEVENLEDLQHEIIIFLLSKIHLFNPENGAKAYSYFGTIVKRWLIIYNEKNYKKKIDKLPMEDLEQDENYSTSLDLDIQEKDIKLSYKDKLSDFTNLYIKYCTDNIFKLFPEEEDAKIADAILELFRKRDNLEIFNKKALYIYIREMVDVKTPKITKIADVLGNIFKKSYTYYLEHGIVKF